MINKKLRDESYLRLISKKNNYVKFDFKNKFLNLIPGILSPLYKIFLILFGASIGKNVKFKGKIFFKIKGKFKNITIKNNVILGKNVDLRNRENGKIILNDNSYLDDNVRIIAARDGKINIGKYSEIGINTIINSGGNLNIGEFVLIANNVNINTSSHQTYKNQYIKDQNHIHGNIDISDDVWVGGFTTIVMNTKIGLGAVVGANSLVNSDINEFSINVGCPTKEIKKRL